MNKRLRAKYARRLVLNPASPIGKPIGRERALELAAMVKTKVRTGGRPRSKDRCPCGKFTKPRAKQRHHKCVAPEAAQRLAATLRQEFREIIDLLDEPEVSE